MSRKSMVRVDILKDESTPTTKVSYNGEIIMDVTPTGNHEYKCKILGTREVWCCDKLPPILKMLRKRSEDIYFAPKIPHGNRVRTDILETGVCRIDDLYEITVVRW